MPFLSALIIFVKMWFPKIVALHAKGKEVVWRAKSFWKNSRTFLLLHRNTLGMFFFYSSVSLFSADLKQVRNETLVRRNRRNYSVTRTKINLSPFPLLPSPPPPSHVKSMVPSREALAHSIPPTQPKTNSEEEVTVLIIFVLLFFLTGSPKSDRCTGNWVQQQGNETRRTGKNYFYTLFEVSFINVSRFKRSKVTV